MNFLPFAFLLLHLLYYLYRAILNRTKSFKAGHIPVKRYDYAIRTRNDKWRPIRAFYCGSRLKEKKLKNNINNII